MASPMVLSVSRDHIQLPVRRSVTLGDQTWADYEALLASRRDDAAIKICFNHLVEQHYQHGLHGQQNS